MSQTNENLESIPMCSSSHCFCNNKKCDYLHKQYGLKKWVFRLILIVIIAGAIVPFASEVFCTIWFPDVVLGLNTWNQFVSIILGVIATVLSIVSLIMGFKNYDDTLAVQEKYMQALEKISSIAKDLDKVKNDVNNMAALKERIPVATPKKISNQWEQEPEDILDSKSEDESVQSDK